MPIRFACPECQARLKVGSRHVGRWIDCPSCKTSLVVPAADAVAESGPASPSIGGPRPSQQRDSRRGETSKRAKGAPEEGPPPMPTAAPTAEKQPKETAAVFAALAVGDQEGDDSLPPMSFSDPDRDEDDGMDMTPMVDVTFLLLIFFMLTATFAMQKSLDMPAPDNNEAVSQSRTIEEIEEDDEYIIVRIDEDSRIWVEDAQPPSKQELLSLLRKLIEKPLDGATKPPNKLFVMANGNARHEKVVEALDAGAALGLEDVRLTTTEEDEF